MPASESTGEPAPERFAPEELASVLPGYALRPLPAGRHGLARSQIVRNQRMRLMGAMLRALPEHGYVGTTIADLAGGARVSRAAFYEQFNGKEECFLATYDLAAEWFCERVEGAAADSDWPRRMRAGVSMSLRLLAANPSLAHLFAINAFEAGPAARARQQAFVTAFAKALRGGRAEQPDLPAELEEMLLDGAVATIARYAHAGRVEQLPDAMEELLQYLLIPYLGALGARQVLRDAA